jgi:TPR repeat protein
MAYQLFKKSALQGDLISIYNIGQMYKLGAEVNKSNVMAYAHYKIALATNDEDIKKDYDGLKSKMTPAEIQQGDEEAKKLLREYGIK